MTDPAEPSERRCIACQSSLANEASVCPVCTRFLSRSSPDTNSCYMLVFFSDNAPEVGQLNAFFAPGKVKLATVNLDAALYYYSTNDATLHSGPFRAVAAFYDLKKDCSQATAAARP